jgi:O-antigen/teichoic acid export membrane protein
MLKKLSGNILIYGGTNAIKSLAPFLMLPILTTYLTISDYGLLSLVEVSILFLAPFITLNINSAINIEYFKSSKTNLKDYISNALILSFLAMCIIFILLIFSKGTISQSLHLPFDLILWLPIFAFLRVISSIVLGLYQVSDQPKKFAIFTIFQTLIDLLLSYVLVVFYTHGYIGRLEGIYGTLFISSIVGIYILYKLGYLSNVIHFKYSKNILTYGVPLIPHVLGGVILAMSDRYFLSYFFGNEEVGYYSVAYQISGLMLLVSVAANQAWTPMLFRFLQNFKENEFTIYRYSIYLSISFLFSGICIYFVSDFIFYLLVDEKFFQAKAYFPYLLIGFIFQSFYYIFTNYLFYEGKTVLLAKLTFFSAIINLILNYILILQYGAIGVAYATAITYIIHFLTVSYIVTFMIRKKMVIKI